MTMADPNKMVTVNLDRERMYEAPGGTTVVTVGPGEVEVPAWVAEHWATSQPPPSTPPGAAQGNASNDIAALRAEVAELRAKVDRLTGKPAEAILDAPPTADQLQYTVDTTAQPPAPVRRPGRPEIVAGETGAQPKSTKQKGF